jgi:hypothetical protein
MGRKPVLGLAGLFLASVTLTGCENTDWCCWGKKTPEKPVVPIDTVHAQKAPPKMWDNEPISRAPKVETPVVPPADSSVTLPNSTTPRTGFGSPEEQEIAPPMPPKSVDGPDLNDPLTPLPNTPAKPPVTGPETNRGAKIAPPTDPAPVLEDPLPSLAAPPPPKPIPDGSTKSSSKYQTTPPSPDDPPPPVGVPAIKGGGLKAN